MSDELKQTGVIVKMLSGFYYVMTSDGKTVRCRARGVFRKDGVSPLAGDRVIFSEHSGDGAVEQILERKNVMMRPAAANIDRVVIISSFCVPAPNTLIIDLMTAIAENNGIEAVIVFNKSDLGNLKDIAGVYTNAGFKVFVVSADTGEGIEELKNYLSSGFSVFTGNTGVGKSSILNRLLPYANIPTGGVSEKLGRGKHTTRHIELYSLCDGAFIADTPGFSSLSFDEAGFIPAYDLPFCFPDINRYADNCKFTGCTHTAECGCSVKKALEEGKIEASRYESYKILFDKVKDIKDWEIKKGKFKI